MTASRIDTSRWTREDWLDHFVARWWGDHPTGPAPSVADVLAEFSLWDPEWIELALSEVGAEPRFTIQLVLDEYHVANFETMSGGDVDHFSGQMSDITLADEIDRLPGLGHALTEFIHHPGQIAIRLIGRNRSVRIFPVKTWNVELAGCVFNELRTDDYRLTFRCVAR